MYEDNGNKDIQYNIEVKTKRGKERKCTHPLKEKVFQNSLNNVKYNL